MQWEPSTADRKHSAQEDTAELGAQGHGACRQLRLAGRGAAFAAGRGARMEARAEAPCWEARPRDLRFVLRAVGNH